MPSLRHKRVLLGVTGGIAAYKSADLVRRLQDAGADVRVVMTKGAQEFITPLTLQALSGNPVHIDLLDPKAEAAMGHIELSRWADVVLIAPATANFMAKLVTGDGSDLLTTLCLATRSPIAIAPAMNQGMWANEATQNNLSALQARGVHVFGPASGGQACGDVGMGRMLEPVDIAEATAQLFESGQLSGKKVIITAGPTREALDPVRYISNHSSGKMGFALAEAAVEAGAEVTLIAGPVSQSTPDHVSRVDVISANDMLSAVNESLEGCDIFIGAAAVADYRPEQVAKEKMKKGDGDSMTISMVKNPDIIATVAQKDNKPFCVGFAAETQNVNEYAQQKRVAKNLDMIIANDVSNPAIGFNSDENAVTVFFNEGQNTYSQMNKKQLARTLIDAIAERYNAEKRST